MKILSINLRNDGISLFKKSNWKERLISTVELIKEEQPDIIGTQEMTHKAKKQLTYLLKLNNLTYNFYGHSRLRKNSIYDEYNCILVKTNIKVMNSKTYSLSNTPEIPKTKFKYDFFPRIVNYIETEDFYCYNTHLTNKPQKNKLLQLECITKLIKENTKNKPILITGDFNTGYRNLKDFCKDNNLIDITKDIGKTYSTIKEIYHLDHILITKDLNYDQVTKYTNRYKGIYPSDHYPIGANIIIKNTKKRV
ncbi:MAG: endonuclease/exonuclease/phosphatase family protein [Bacilli bacterium]